MKEEVALVGGTKAKIDGLSLVLTGPKGEVRKILSYPKIKVSVDGSKVIVEGGDTRRDRRVINTFVAHIGNMIDGVTKGFEYRLKVCFVHFPVSVKRQGNSMLIENFLGEKKPRASRIMEGVDVEIKGNDITVRGIDREKVSQTAANMEQICRIRGYDRRVFQDGIYIVSKGGDE